MATEIDASAIEKSHDNSLRETKSIEEEIQYRTEALVPQMDTQSQSTQSLANYGSPKEYERYRKHRS